ncbi:MAG TPA: PAS domain S-box protein [Acidimicrobiales bacterium]|nr:PAS domain S-box protein [Acidimicrobiales bacterium]
MTEEDVVAFLDLSTELFGAFDAAGRFVWANGVMAAALGYTEEELRQMPLALLVHPEDAEATDVMVRTGPTDAPAAAVETRWRHRDGTWRWLEWTTRTADTGLVYAAARDITDRHLARAAVHSGGARLRAIVEHAPNAMFAKDLADRYVMVNEAFLDGSELKREDVLGRTAAEIWPGSVDPQRDDDADLLVAGATRTRDELVQLADGPHTLMTERFPLRDGDGCIVGTAGIATDITDRVAVESSSAERERLLETIVQASPDIVTILDETGHVREVSQASTRILGYELEDPVHDELEALVHADDLAKIYREYALLLTLEGTSLDIRYRVRHSDGHWITLDSRGQSIVGEEGRVVGALVMSRDITEDLLFESELLAAVEVAERASLAKSEFLSRMSHELRTPLNAVLGFAQLLEMDDLSEQQGQAVGHILRAGKHLLDLIDEVLDIARIESGHLDLSLEPVLVLDVLGDAVDLARPLAEHQDVRLAVDTTSCPAETYVQADRQRLLQVLLNLLSNATKYNTRTGRVDISVSRADHGRAEISVSDTGPGIHPEDIERVFEPFDRLGAERSGVEGTGVGLTLSKHLIERMGGEIDLRSTVGVGSTFTVLLPMTDVPDEFAPIEPAPSDPAALRGALRILHVEDNLDNLALVEQVLARHQEVELIAATLGGLALELARRHRPDVILLDLHLPDMSGVDVLGGLRADPVTMEIPVVVVSADATAERIERLEAARVAAYLTKPIDVRELVRVIESVARHRGGDS